MNDFVKTFVGLLVLGAGGGEFFKGIAAQFGIETAALTQSAPQTAGFGLLLMGLGALILPRSKDKSE